MKGIIDVVAGLQKLAVRIGEALWWVGPTLARVVVGFVFFQSGWGKLHDLPKVIDFFTSLGLPAPAFQARFASTTEFACGTLLLVGFATRFAVVPLIITMVVAIRTALWDQVDGISSLFGIVEFLYIALLVWLGTTGAGPLSIDWLLERRGEPAEAAPVLKRSTSRVLV